VETAVIVMQSGYSPKQAMCPQTMEICSVCCFRTNTNVDCQQRRDMFVVVHLSLDEPRSRRVEHRADFFAAILERLLTSNSAVVDVCEGDKSVGPQAARHLQEISTSRVKC
jgi:hypothetical protein